MVRFLTRLTLTGLLVLLCLSVVPPARAAEQVAVSLPGFSVTLNGQTASSAHSRYPFLVYKDITYFPMTFYDGRLLGLYTQWTGQAGLEIRKNDAPFYEYVREVTEEPNDLIQTAQIVQGPVRVNGTRIDNSKEPYPLLLFRDVTYFPLTWRFAVDEFGWQYAFDAENGLVITNPEATFETPEGWNGTSEYGLTIMGTGTMPLFFTLDSGVDPFGDRLPYPRLNLYNITGRDIELLPAAQTWEYQISRLMGSEEELIYRRAVPFYSGPLAENHYLYASIDDSAWKASVTPGTYRLSVQYPDQLFYRLAGTEEVLQTPVKGDGYAQQLSHVVVIE